ncbi:MAG: beta-ketoacyl synthase N-terminal-like domain-containing protein [Leptothrix sp. (in: b-proteobacteria)]
MSEAVFIVGLGACTAIGRSAWASAAAVRAGIAGFTQHPYMIDTAGEPMRAAIAPWIDINVQGVDRFEELLFPAIEEALAILDGQTIDSRRWALALGLPSPRPGLPKNLAPDLLVRARRRFSNSIASAATFENGHAAGLIGLQAAVNKLRSGGLDGCIVAGVDSWIEPETLEWLEENDQLHSAGPLNNAWGFIPGEAGAALLLMRESEVKKYHLEPLAAVLFVGTAHEPKRIKTETVCIGEGLTAAFRATLAGLPSGALVTDIYCDMNGEPYRADEFGFTALRTKEYFESASDFSSPADCWGDVGAAGGLLHLSLAAAASHKGYAKGELVFTWASAEMGERAAVLLACATPVTITAVRG